MAACIICRILRYLKPPLPSVKVWSVQSLPDLTWGKYPYTHPPVIRSGPTLQFVRIMVPTVCRIVTPSSPSPLPQCPCIPQLVLHSFVHHLVRRRLHDLPRRIHRSTNRIQDPHCRNDQSPGVRPPPSCHPHELLDPVHVGPKWTPKSLMSLDIWSSVQPKTFHPIHYTTHTHNFSHTHKFSSLVSWHPQTNTVMCVYVCMYVSVFMCIFT